MGILNDQWIVNLMTSWKNTNCHRPAQGEIVEIKCWDPENEMEVMKDAWLNKNDNWTDETDIIIKERYVNWWRYK